MAIALILAGELVQILIGFVQAATLPRMAVAVLVLIGWLLLGDAAARRQARPLPGAAVKLGITALMVAAHLVWGGSPGAGNLLPQAWALPLLPLAGTALPLMPLPLAGWGLPAVIGLAGVLATLAWLAGVRVGRR